ncbi:MAG: SMP-30/gluconolactonase/LRE family protein [Pirellulales bacterium]
MPLLSLKDITILADGLDHPECVAWCPDGHIYAGGEAGQIYRISMDGNITQIASTGGFILGLCLDGHGNIYACDLKHQAVMLIDRNAQATVYSNGSPERNMVLPNYAVFDRTGNLYVSDSGGWHENNGCIFLITPDGATRVVSTQASAFPNGMALSSEGADLYVVLSNLPGVVKLPVEGDGALGAPQSVVELPGAVPDGLAFDAQDGLYISCYTPDVIYRLSANGELAIVVEDKERTTIAAPTNVAFAGPDLTTLVAANFGVWHLTQSKMSVPGSSLRYPVLSPEPTILYGSL